MAHPPGLTICTYLVYNAELWQFTSPSDEVLWESSFHYSKIGPCLPPALGAVA